MKNPESDTEKSELTNALGLIFSLFADTHVRRISSIKSWLTHGEKEKKEKKKRRRERKKERKREGEKRRRKKRR